MTDRVKKLTFRAWRRGFREMDLLMGSFANERLAGFSEAELDEFERLLAAPDWEVFNWIIGKDKAPTNYESAVLDQLIDFKFSAQPG